MNLKNVVTSIAFLPALIAIGFLFLSYFMIEFDFSERGKTIKAGLHWLTLKDASTARSICSAIAGGIISLAVFSFSMVMILLNQAASQMSNRILARLIGNRFQQVVLGFYIGTIVYALFLLSTIRDVDSGIYVPAISTYLLIAFTIADIFLFIYFLHYITHSVKYETIIKRVFKATIKKMREECTLIVPDIRLPLHAEGIMIAPEESGLYQNFDKKEMIELCEKENVSIEFFYHEVTYVMRGIPLAKVYGAKTISKKLKKRINILINVGMEHEIDLNYHYGFMQLTEIALKALSPGINDPGTAVISLQALGDLLAFRADHFPQTVLKDKKGVTRVISDQRDFTAIFKRFIYPIWDYGKNDRIVQHEMLHLLRQLKIKSSESVISDMLMLVESSIK